MSMRAHTYAYVCRLVVCVRILRAYVRMRTQTCPKEP